MNIFFIHPGKINPPQNSIAEDIKIRRAINSETVDKGSALSIKAPALKDINAAIISQPLTLISGFSDPNDSLAKEMPVINIIATIENK